MLGRPKLLGGQCRATEGKLGAKKNPSLLSAQTISPPFQGWRDKFREVMDSPKTTQQDSYWAHIGPKVLALRRGSLEPHVPCVQHRVLNFKNKLRWGAQEERQEGSRRRTRKSQTPHFVLFQDPHRLRQRPRWTGSRTECSSSHWLDQGHKYLLSPEASQTRWQGSGKQVYGGSSSGARESRRGRSPSERSSLIPFALPRIYLSPLHPQVCQAQSQSTFSAVSRTGRWPLLYRWENWGPLREENMLKGWEMGELKVEVGWESLPPIPTVSCIWSTALLLKKCPWTSLAWSIIF